MINSKRIIWPDIAKGIGILMVVLYHTFIPALRNDFSYSFIYSLFATIQMPLFFFVSGWLFQLKQKKYEQNKLQSIKTKFIHLMIPYFSFSIIYYVAINIALRISAIAPLVKMSSGYSNSSFLDSIFQILFCQDSLAKNLWFIYVLFIITVLHIIFPKIMAHPISLILQFFLQYILMFVSCPDVIVNTFMYMFFFSFARFIFTYTDKILSAKKYFHILISVIFVCGATFYVLADYNGIFKSNEILHYSKIIIKELVSILGIGFICISSYYISHLKFFINRALTYAGKHSFIIYLIHVPILTPAVVSLLIKTAPFLPTFVDCIIGFAIGIIIPLLISKFILEKVSILNFLFLGVTKKSKNKKSPEVLK